MLEATRRLEADVLRLLINAFREQEWRAGFEAMGADSDTNTVEYMIPAAREVLFGPKQENAQDARK